jgi:hypothetical protein
MIRVGGFLMGLLALGRCNVSMPDLYSALIKVVSAFSGIKMCLSNHL